jgi:hypothetical protein
MCGRVEHADLVRELDGDARRHDVPLGGRQVRCGGVELASVLKGRTTRRDPGVIRTRR